MKQTLISAGVSFGVALLVFHFVGPAISGAMAPKSTAPATP